jgi:hypothetical protein
MRPAANPFCGSTLTTVQPERSSRPLVSKRNCRKDKATQGSQMANHDAYESPESENEGSRKHKIRIPKGVAL